MSIECSFCHATAELGPDMAGAKVRCTACGKLYVARGKATRAQGGPRGLDPLKIFIGAAVLVAALVLWLAVRQRPKPATPTRAAPPAPQVPVAGDVWDSDAVRTVRSVYELAAALDEGALVKSLDGARIAERLGALDPAQAVAFNSLGPVDKQRFLEGIAQGMMRGEGEDAAHFWRPVDAQESLLGPFEASVRITADTRLESGSTQPIESRTFDWRLSRADEQARWKVWSWERVITEDERRLARSKGPRPTRITLPDGTSVFQSEPRHLEPYPGTSPEVEARVEKQIATMLDFSLRPPENNRARDELVAIGRPAIPLLLNKFFEIKLVDTPDDPSLTRLSLVDAALQRITGYRSGFTPLPGQSDERRTIALKAWFAWWDRKGLNFSAPTPGKDLLEDPVAPADPAAPKLEKRADKGGGE